jgi:hypothetical protein
MVLPVDLSEVPHEVRQKMAELFTSENAAALVRARMAQAKAAHLHRRHTPKPKDGFGPVSMVVHPYFRKYWEMKLGPGCWSDPEFVAWLKKRDPDFAVPEVASRIQVGARGRDLPARERTKRFTKSYG